MTAPAISSAPGSARYQGARLLHRFVPATVSQLGAREFRGVVATSALQDDGVALRMSGGNIDRFKGGGPLLDGHDPSELLGTIRVQPTDTQLLGFGRFSSPGVSEIADQRCRELKDGVLRWFSIGFLIDKREPLQGGGWRATAWTLYEVSLTTVPVDPAAIVTERARMLRSTAMSQAIQALARARECASTLNERCERALDAHTRGDHGAVHRQLRAIDSHLEHLATAHDAIARALGADSGGEHDSIANPSAATGAQVSAGQASRSADYRRRQADVLELALPRA